MYTAMKTCVKKILFWVVCGVFVLTAIILFAVSSLDFLRDVWKWIMRLGDGNWRLGILILILAILGAINIFRGALKNAQADDVRLRLKKHGEWRFIFL